MLSLVEGLQAAYVMATTANKTSRHHHETNMRFLFKKSNVRNRRLQNASKLLLLPPCMPSMLLQQIAVIRGAYRRPNLRQHIRKHKDHGIEIPT